jgi:hypothetical protein
LALHISYLELKKHLTLRGFAFGISYRLGQCSSSLRVYVQCPLFIYFLDG